MRHYPGVPADAIEDEATAESVRIIDLFCRDISRAVSDIDTDITALLTPPILASYVTVANEVSLLNERRLIGTSPITITDNGPGVSIAVGIDLSLLGGTPAIAFASTSAAGVATTYVRTDDTLEFPQALQSVTSSATLTFADGGGNSTLTSSLGDLTFVMPSGSDLILDSDPNVGFVGTFNRVGIGTATPSAGFKVDLQTTIPAAGGAGGALQIELVNEATTGAGNIIAAHFGAKTGTASADGDGMGLKVWSWSLVPRGPNKTIPAAWGVDIDFSWSGGDNTSSIVTDAFGVRAVPGTHTAGIYTNLAVLEVGEFPSWFTNVWGVRSKHIGEFGNPAARNDTVLSLSQLATGNVAGALMKLTDKIGDPPSPVDGELWPNGAKLQYKPFGAPLVDLAAAGGGGGDSFMEWAGL